MAWEVDQVQQPPRTFALTGDIADAETCSTNSPVVGGRDIWLLVQSADSV